MAGRLKPLDVVRMTQPGKYADGDGLYLIVAGPTSKNWSYRYWKDGKERWHGLGSPLRLTDWIMAFEGVVFFLSKAAITLRSYGDKLRIAPVPRCCRIPMAMA